MQENLACVSKWVVRETVTLPTIPNLVCYRDFIRPFWLFGLGPTYLTTYSVTRNFSQKTGSVSQVWQRVYVLCINKCSLLAVVWRSLRRADHSFGGVVLSMVCPMRVIAKPRKGRPWPRMRSKPHKEEKLTAVFFKNTNLNTVVGAWGGVVVKALRY